MKTSKRTKSILALSLILVAAMVLLDYGSMVKADYGNSGSISGKITKKDWRESTVTIKHYESSKKDIYDVKTFLINDETRIMKNGKEIKFPDLDVMDQVLIDFQIAMEGGHIIAMTITVKE